LLYSISESIGLFNFEGAHDIEHYGVEK